MSQQFVEQFTVPASSPYTYDVQNPTGATLVQVQSAAGVPVSGCTLSAGVLTVPAAEASAVLWVIYDATPTSSYTGSKAQAGRGTTVSIGSTPVLIGELSDFPLNRPDWDFVETTNFESQSDAEMLSTIRKAPTIDMKGNRVSSDAGQQAVETAYQNGSLQPFVVTLPKTSSQTTVGDKYSFSAYVKNANFSIQTTKQVEFSISLQVSGPCTFTAGS